MDLFDVDRIENSDASISSPSVARASTSDHLSAVDPQAALAWGLMICCCAITVVLIAAIVLL